MSGPFARAGERLDRIAEWIAARLPRESRTRRRAWVVAAIFLTLAPAVFVAQRQASFSTTVELYPQRGVGPLPTERGALEPGYLLSDGLLRSEVQGATGEGPSLYDEVVFRRFPPRGTYIMTVTRPTPRAARRAADAVALQVAYASGRQVGFAAQALIEPLQERLANERLSARQRAVLRRRLASYRRIARSPRNRLIASAKAPEPKLEHWADRVTDALPGRFPGRPSPFWAGVAGLSVALLLWAAALRFAPPVIRPEPAAAPSRSEPGYWERLRDRLTPEPAGTAGAAPTTGGLGLTRWRLAVWILALVIAPLLTLVWIATNAVNVPFFDEWNGLVPLFRAAADGTLDVGSFWAQHNEHRPLVPRTLQFGLAYVTGWDVRAELYLNFAVAVGTFAVLLVLLRRTLDRLAFLAAAVVASVIFFSPVQWENWLWGWQFGWFLSNLALVGALWALTFLVDRSLRWGLAVAAACGVVATLSLGNGLLVWPAGLVVLLLRRRPWIVWTVLSIVVPVLYFAGWEGSSSYSPTVFQLAEFVVLYIGRALGVSDLTGGLVGTALLVGFLVGAAYVVGRRRDTELVERAVPWLGAGLYTLGAAVVTGYGRAGPGVAAVSRYYGIAAVFAISTMALLLTIARQDDVAGRTISVSTRRWAIAVVTIPLLLAAAANYRSGFNAMEKRGNELEAIADCTRRVVGLSDPCLNRPLAGFKQERLDGIFYLRSKGWAGYSKQPRLQTRPRPRPGSGG